MRTVCLLMVCVAASAAQDTVSVASIAAPPGAAANLSLVLTTSHPNVTGLQWELNLPAGFTFTASTKLKSTLLACHLQRCVLIGTGPGPQPVIASGTTVAVLAVQVPPQANGDIPVSIVNAIESFANGSGASVSGAAATIATGVAPPPDATKPKASPVNFFAEKTPQRLDAGPDGPVELGIQFTSSTNGTVIGVRFYKGPANTGGHVAHLWSASGSLLAKAAFASETASGWQNAVFDTPVPVSAGEVYVASYGCERGHYAADEHVFDSKLDQGVLSAPVNAGVFADGLASFPRQGERGTNYWVDLIFQPK